MKTAIIVLLGALGVLGNAELKAQGPTIAALAEQQALTAAAAEAKEQNELSQAVSEAGNSPVDYIHAVERHLAKFPDSKQRASLEKALVRAALETNDNERIILYGERVLARETPDDMQLLERVIRALVEKGDAQTGARAFVLVKRYEADLQATRKQLPPGHLSPAIWSDLVDANVAAAMALEANAMGNTNNAAEAVQIAQRAWETYPIAEAARAEAHWLSKLGRNKEAIEYYADAFTLEDPRTTANDRTNDRARLGEVYRRVNQNENGLGEVVLAAYDRMAALKAARAASLKERDPNSQTVDIPDFVLPAVDGSAALRLSSLKGKVVVMNFWATWCIPCREEHPLIENVKKRYKDATDVVFLAVDADDDLSLVAPFVKEQSWEPGYFEAGLGRRLNISSIPAMVVLDGSGQLVSHMAGVEPDRFEASLIDRIEAARHPVIPQ